MRALILAAALALTATACSTHANRSPAPSAPSTTPVVPLSVSQATKATLTLSDLPKRTGWEGAVAPDPNPDHKSTPISQYTYAPADCWMVRDPLRDQSKPATAVQGKFLVRADNPSDDVIITELM